MDEPKLIEDAVGPLAAAAASFPLLVYDYEHGGDPPEFSQTVLSVGGGNGNNNCSTRTVRVPELCDYRCLETPQGLVLMVDDTTSGRRRPCWLWNPQTGEKTALPAMDAAGAEIELPHHCRCLISDPTTTSEEDDDDDPRDSLVLVYDLSRPELLYCRIRAGGAGAGGGWVKQTYDMGIEIPAPEENRPVPITVITEMAAVRGVFFYLQSRDEIAALVAFADDPEPHLDLVDTFDAPLPLPPALELAAADEGLIVIRSYLLESSGELFRVCLFYVVGCSTMDMERIDEVGAYVMDLSTKQWSRVTDIGDAAFLLGSGPGCFAASCPAAEHGLKRGCVYLADDSNGVHVFDLKDGTRELVSPTMAIPAAAALSREPFWLLPVRPR